MKRVLAVTVVIIVIIAAFTGVMLVTYSAKPTGTPAAFVGVTYCGNSVEQGKQLIDKVKGYTNLFVLQSGVLQRDFNSVDQLGDYAVAAGMYFLPYFGDFVSSTFTIWLDSAKEKWGSHLLGVYYGDEAGGKMLDDYVEFKDQATGDSIIKTKYGDIVVEKPTGVVINYQLDGTIRLYEPASADDSTGINNEATFYPNGTIVIVKPAPNGFSYQTYQQLAAQKPFKDADDSAQRFLARDQDTLTILNNSSVTIFTSDYALYWFDYQSGYDVVLGQVGWNLSLSQQIGLMRGAAAAQNKDWGVVITWKYQQWPYLANGTKILNQMKTAYECGAKYFVLFNYYESDSNPLGTLQDEHFQALQSFWNNVVNNPNEVQGSIKADSVLVLPKNYGSGMRWDGDKTWGIFLADQHSALIWNNLQNVLQNHGLKTDIVYENSNFSKSTYQNVIYWNSSLYELG